MKKNILQKRWQKIKSQLRQKKNEYCVKFNDSWCNKFKSIQKYRNGDGFSLCTVCRSDVSVVHGGESEDTSKHKEYMNSTKRQRKLTDFSASSATANLDQKVVKAELPFSSFLVEQTSL